MKWTNMVVAIVAIALIPILIQQCTTCTHQQDIIKLECMKNGKTEAECRFTH